LFEISSSSDGVIEFSGDFRLCSPQNNDDDEDCDVMSADVMSGSGGDVDATPPPSWSTDSAKSDQHQHDRPETSSSAELHRTSSAQPEVTSQRDTGSELATTSGGAVDSLVIVVDMTERSPSRTLHPLTPSGLPPSYRFITATPAFVVGDSGVVAERVTILCSYRVTAVVKK